MKSSDELKKGLEHCAQYDSDCAACPYAGDWCIDRICEDALAYIRQLEAKVEGLERVRATLQAGNGELREATWKQELCKRRLEEERNALLNDLREADRVDCMHCKHCTEIASCDLQCDDCKQKCVCNACRDGHLWEWRGVKKEAP